MDENEDLRISLESQGHISRDGWLWVCGRCPRTAYLQGADGLLDHIDIVHRKGTFQLHLVVQ